MNIKNLSISPMNDGYEANVVLEDGHNAISKKQGSTEQAMEWAVNYAESYDEARSASSDPTLAESTKQTGMLDSEALEKLEQKHNEENHTEDPKDSNTKDDENAKVEA